MGWGLGIKLGVRYVRGTWAEISSSSRSTLERVMMLRTRSKESKRC